MQVIQNLKKVFYKILPNLQDARYILEPNEDLKKLLF